MAENFTRIDGDGIGRRIFIGVPGTADNSEVLETNDVTDLDTFTIACTAGGFDVYVTLDGTNWLTNPITMTDLSNATTTPVLAGTSQRLYGFAGPFKGIRVLQNGGVNVANLTLFGKRTAT